VNERQEPNGAAVGDVEFAGFLEPESLQERKVATVKQKRR